MKFSAVGFSILLNISLSLFNATGQAVAQSIQTDGTTPTQPASCSGDCTIEGGLQQGDNLFHSFEKFNVDVDATVSLQDPGVANILSRVTGNELSEILGTLGVSGGDANLFLINPNGIIFGQDSSLDLNGSFLATTADAIRFGEQGLLNTASNNIPLLTIDPSALFFAEGDAGIIRNESIAPAGENPSNTQISALGLRVANGESLLLVGGDVILDEGGLYASGGRIELGGLAEAGEIRLDFDLERQNLILGFPIQIKRANVLLTNEAIVNVAADNRGDIAVNAQNISISTGSSLRAGIGLGLGTDDSRAGNITLNASDKVEIDNANGVFNEIAPEATGNAGNINLDAGSSFVSNNSNIQTATFGMGNAGDIEINVPDGAVKISNSSRINSSVQSSTAQNLGNFVAIGEGGDIQVVAQEISLKDGSFIDVSTLGQGDAGNIDISLKDSLDIASNSAILSLVSLGAIGNGGNITVEANNISLKSGSQLGSNVFGQGKGGNISLNVLDLVNITGFSTDGFSSGIVTATEEEGKGQAGNIAINTDNFRIADGGLVSSQTLNEGDGGSISIDANTFEAIDGGQVATSAASSGNAGDMNIQVSNNLLLSGSDSNFANRFAEFGEEFVGNEAPGNSGFFANVRPEASGAGGNINVAASRLDIQDSAEINVSAAGTGAAGSLSIDAQEVALDLGSLTAETTVGSQGNISLNNADTLLLNNNSQITTNAFESATGGDITISSNGIALLDNSNITAKAVRGQGGNIQITTQGIFQEPDSEITAASQLGIDGTVTFNTPEVDPTSGVFELPNVPVDADAILAQDLCKLEDEKIAKGSSFVITGRGGLIPTSESSLDNRDRLVDWASEDVEVSQNGAVGIRRREKSELTKGNYPAIAQSHGLLVAKDGSTWLTANASDTNLANAGIIHPDCGTSP